jgi:hypothetical protein
MISKTTRAQIAVLAALLCTSAATAQDNRGTPSSAVPEAEQVRSQRGLPIGFRTKRRPGGQQKQITESAARRERRPSFAQARQKCRVRGTRS